MSGVPTLDCWHCKNGNELITVKAKTTVVVLAVMGLKNFMYEPEKMNAICECSTHNDVVAYLFLNAIIFNYY